jgi:hypothetical protein
MMFTLDIEELYKKLTIELLSGNTPFLLLISKRPFRTDRNKQCR